ncbi:hypothetical protein ACA910_005173 [Epithemia clementina (nom. ined.)]
MRKAEYAEAARIFQLALDRIEPECMQDDNSDDDYDDDDDDDEDMNEDEGDNDFDDESFNFELEGVTVSPPPAVISQENFRAFALYDRALTVVPLSSSTRLECNNFSGQQHQQQQSSSRNTTIPSSLSNSPFSSSTAGAPFGLEDREILSSPARCHFIASSLFYNKALCYHLQGLMHGRDADFEEPLFNYNVAWGILSDFPTPNPPKLLLELSLLNNKGHVHYRLVDVMETETCLDRMDTLLAEFQYDGRSCIPPPLAHFAQNLSHNRQQLTTLLLPMA